jgi:hypothetical protein
MKAQTLSASFIYNKRMALPDISVKLTLIEVSGRLLPVQQQNQVSFGAGA